MPLFFTSIKWSLSCFYSENFITSADWYREVPHRHTCCIGHASEERMSIQHITSDTSVADLVTNIKLCSIQYAFGWNSWVSTWATSQLWKMETDNIIQNTMLLYFMCTRQTNKNCNFQLLLSNGNCSYRSKLTTCLLQTLFSQEDEQNVQMNAFQW